MNDRDLLQDFLDERLAGLRRDLATTKLSEQSLASLSVHGTTIGAFKINQGKEAVAFSDGKVSEGQLLQPLSLVYEKIIDIDRKSVMLISGVPSIAKEYCKLVEVNIDNYEKMQEEELSSKGKVRQIETLMLKNFALAAQGLIVSPIFVTYDNQHGARIFSFSPDGSSVEKYDYVMSGSGKIAQPILFNDWREDLNREEGIKLAKKVVGIASASESASGGKIYIRIIAAEGVEKVEEGL